MVFWKILSFTLLLTLMTEVQHAQGNCDIISITSPTAYSLNIKWIGFPGCTNYVMELKAVNPASAIPVVLYLTASTTEKLVQGLKPGTVYQVTLKVYQFNYLVCINSKIAQTVPATSQITFLKAISSTAITFQWASAMGANAYVLVVEGAFHNEYHNMTYTTLTGEMVALQPAKIYNCYVYSSNAAGLGAKSSVKKVSTLFSTPANVNVTAVNDSTVLVTWSSVSSVVFYQVTLTDDNQPDLPPISWNPSVTFIRIPNLKPCSRYTIGVSAVNLFLQPGESNNVPYTTISISKVSSISGNYDCKSGAATITWEPVYGAYSYHAVATGRTGATFTCSSSSTSCEISTLECGEQYNVEITAIGNCESTSDLSYSFETVPCPPEDLEFVYECFSNEIMFSWSPTNKTAYYIATAVDSDGVVKECHTLFTYCHFTHADCGHSYSFTVRSVYSDGQSCVPMSSMPLTMSTAPCPPKNFYSTSLDCYSGVLIHTWDPAPGALSYTVQARGNQDDILNCTSQNTSCEMTDVKCGQSISVWITASNDNCTTEPMLVDQTETVPCAPQYVSVVNTCNPFSVTLSWLASNDAIFYLAKAVDSGGLVNYCSTADTQCEIQGLQCGQSYEAFVMSSNFFCNSTESQLVTAYTAPCQPVNLSVDMNCGNTDALLSWDAQNGAGNYIGFAQTTDSPALYCKTMNTSCSFEGLNCSAVYNFTVLASNEWCNSSISKALSGEKAPCSPVGLHVMPSVVENHNQLLKVNWSAVECPNSLYLLEVLEGFETLFRMYSYWTERTYFEKPVPCSSAYNASVRAQNSGRISAPSAVVTGITAPCPPQSATFSGTDSSALVSWNASAYASMYHVYKVNNFSRTEVCYTSQLSCTVTNISSDLIILTASNKAGESQATNVQAVRRKRDLKQTHTEELGSLQLTITRVTADSLWLDWSSVEGIEFYTLRIQEQSHLQSPEPIILNVYGEAAVVSALKSATTYCITLSTSNSSRGQISSRPENLCVQTSSLSEAGMGDNKSNL